MSHTLGISGAVICSQSAVFIQSAVLVYATGGICPETAVRLRWSAALSMVENECQDRLPRCKARWCQHSDQRLYNANSRSTLFSIDGEATPLKTMSTVRAGLGSALLLKQAFTFSPRRSTAINMMMHCMVLDSPQLSASSVEGLGLVLTASQVHSASDGILQAACIVTPPGRFTTILCCKRRRIGGPGRTHNPDT